MSYPTLSGVPDVPVNVVFSRLYCNDNDEDHMAAQIEESGKVKVGNSWKFHQDAHSSMIFNAKQKIHGKIPILSKGKGKAHTHWEASADEEMDLEGNSIVEKEMTVEFPSNKIPAHTSMRYTFTQFQGELKKVPYEASTKCTKWRAVCIDDEKHGCDFKDTCVHEKGASGTIDSMMYTEVLETWTDETHNVKSCKHIARLHTDIDETLHINVTSLSMVV
jgi:hypothetical protein